MAEADVPQLGKVDELGDGLANFRVHSAQPSVEQQRFIVFHQKMVELQVARLRKDRDAIDVRRDFRGDCHASLLNRISGWPFYFEFPATHAPKELTPVGASSLRFGTWPTPAPARSRIAGRNLPR